MDPVSTVALTLSVAGLTSRIIEQIHRVKSSVSRFDVELAQTTGFQHLLRQSTSLQLSIEHILKYCDEHGLESLGENSVAYLTRLHQACDCVLKFSETIASEDKTKSRTRPKFKQSWAGPIFSARVREYEKHSAELANMILDLQMEMNTLILKSIIPQASSSSVQAFLPAHEDALNRRKEEPATSTTSGTVVDGGTSVDNEHKVSPNSNSRGTATVADVLQATRQVALASQDLTGHMARVERQDNDANGPLQLSSDGWPLNADGSPAKWRCICIHVWFCVATTVVSSAIVSAVLSVATHDVSTGFTIGAYMVTVGALIAAVLLTRHNHACVMQQYRRLD